MKTRLFLAFMMIVIALIGTFICQQILIPEIGTDAAIAQVTEDATGAGVRATDRMNTYIGVGWFAFVFIANMLIWKGYKPG